MNIVVFKRTRYHTPASWSECSRQEMAAAALLRLTEHPSGRLELVNTMLGGRRAITRQMRPEDVVHITQWVFDQDPKVELTSFHHQGREWLMPKADLSDMELAEYISADAAFRLYAKKGSPQYLGYFLACLCRPAVPEEEKQRSTFRGYRRMPFYSLLAEENGPSFLTLDHKLQATIILWWTTAVAALIKRFPNLFTTSEPANKGGEGWMPIVHQLAAQGKYGPLEGVYRTDVVTIFLGLEYDRRRGKERA